MSFCLVLMLIAGLVAVSAGTLERRGISPVSAGLCLAPLALGALRLLR